MYPPLFAVSRYEVILFGGLILLAFLALLALFFFGAWLRRRPNASCPYTTKPLRYGSDIDWMTAEIVLKYLYETHEYDNRIFDLRKAAFCRDTGRIFPGSIDWFERAEVDWTFLEHRYPGDYVSWGSLTDEQQKMIKELHESLEGFQTEYSSPTSSPRKIEPEYAYSSPGPLYVDVNTNILLGWKIVPETTLEVLIVQKPKKGYIPS